MLLYPHIRYRRYDKAMVRCDSQQNIYCRKTYAINYWRYKKNIERNKGRYVCRLCILKERYGVDNQRYLDPRIKKLYLGE